MLFSVKGNIEKRDAPKLVADNNRKDIPPIKPPLLSAHSGGSLRITKIIMPQFDREAIDPCVYCPQDLACLALEVAS